MIKAELQKGDGLPSGRIWLRSVVKSVQRALENAGRPMGVDGKFGSGTVRELKAFQTEQGLMPTGIVDKATWQALEPHLQAAGGDHANIVAAELNKFDGDLDWVHEREGHLGKPYWPKGASGVTLDPGVDLGHVPPDKVEELYAGILTKKDLNTLKPAFGIKGKDALTALNTIPGIRDIRINRDQAYEVMPHAARPYWDGIVRRFGATARKDTPPSVKTVMLSLAYNRGVFNAGLEPLGALLQARNWTKLAATIGAMQQSHKLQGIRTRRREEADVIRAELDFLK